MVDMWEIRKEGRVYVRSEVENCGYDEGMLLSLKRNGFSLYCNGKCVMRGYKVKQ